MKRQYAKPQVELSYFTEEENLLALSDVNDAVIDEDATDEAWARGYVFPFSDEAYE